MVPRLRHALVASRGRGFHARLKAARDVKPGREERIATSMRLRPTRAVKHTVAQMFDLVADVDRYRNRAAVPAALRAASSYRGGEGRNPRGVDDGRFMAAARAF